MFWPLDVIIVPSEDMELHLNSKDVPFCEVQTDQLSWIKLRGVHLFSKHQRFSNCCTFNFNPFKILWIFLKRQGCM